MTQETLQWLIGWVVALILVTILSIIGWMVSDSRKIVAGFIKCPVIYNLDNRARISHVWAKDCTLIKQLEVKKEIINGL